MPRSVSLAVFLFLPFGMAGMSLNAQKNDSLQLENSIGRAIAYLNNRIDSNKIYYLITPLLTPLKEYYNLPISDQIEFVQNRQMKESEKKTLCLYSALFRFKSRKENNAILHTKWNGIEALNLYSLYCNKILSRKDFLTLFDSSLALNGYELTHAYLATLIIKRTKCICKKENLKLEKRAWENLKKMIPIINQSEFSDLDIEVMALALYGHEIESISPELISKLLALQNMDGSWSLSNNTSKLFKDHSTVLALWALLEWKFKEDSFLYLPMN